MRHSRGLSELSARAAKPARPVSGSRGRRPRREWGCRSSHRARPRGVPLIGSSRGAYRDVSELIAAIEHSMQGYDDRARRSSGRSPPMTCSPRRKCKALPGRSTGRSVRSVDDDDRASSDVAGFARPVCRASPSASARATGRCPSRRMTRWAPRQGGHLVAVGPQIVPTSPPWAKRHRSGGAPFVSEKPPSVSEMPPFCERKAPLCEVSRKFQRG